MHDEFIALLKSKLDHIEDIEAAEDMPSLCFSREHVVEMMLILRDDPELHFEMLSDLCGVDYLDYGIDDWRGDASTTMGFTRAKTLQHERHSGNWSKPRFATVYHLLSLKYNRRVRVKVYLDIEDLKTPSVMHIWPTADWFEREAYDLYGFIYTDHPDLRRLLTDYGFKGHPFRKDYPMEGKYELYYDADKERCVFQPVTINARVNIPKVIRKDNRYIPNEGVAKESSDA